MRFRSDDLVFLLGAGASRDGGILTSREMIDELERELARANGITHASLYHYFKASILYGEGIKGVFGSEANFNIERLVSVISEVQKRDEHSLYPFIGSWHPKLSELAGSRFEGVTAFRKFIFQLLKKFIAIRDPRRIEYFKGFNRFCQELGFPLRVFTLNYDRCVESACSGVETGFDVDRLWNYLQFESNDVEVFLYKLHGSIDWERSESGSLRTIHEQSNIDEPEMIFGTAYKLQYKDPYFWLTNQFREQTLKARVIVTLGYSFGDDHINTMLGEAIGKKASKLIAISPLDLNTDAAMHQRFIAQTLKLSDISQVTCLSQGAEEFLNNHLTLNYLSSLVPQTEVSFP